MQGEVLEVKVLGLSTASFKMELSYSTRSALTFTLTLTLTITLTTLTLGPHYSLAPCLAGLQGWPGYQLAL